MYQVGCLQLVYINKMSTCTLVMLKLLYGREYIPACYEGPWVWPVSEDRWVWPVGFEGVASECELMGVASE